MCKIENVRSPDGMKTDCKAKVDFCASNTVKYNGFTFYALPITGKWLSVSVFLSCNSPSPVYEEEKEIVHLDDCFYW